MAGWSMDLEDYAKKKTKEIKSIKRAYAFALYSSIIQKTPVGTLPDDKLGGRARGNWNISISRPDGSTSETRQPKYSSLDDVPDSDGDETIYISNNLPYINVLEYGGYPNPPKGGNGKTVNGFSKQAPEGMVRVTIANKDNLFKSAVNAVRGGD